MFVFLQFLRLHVEGVCLSVMLTAMTSQDVLPARCDHCSGCLARMQREKDAEDCGLTAQVRDVTPIALDIVTQLETPQGYINLVKHCKYTFLSCLSLFVC